MKKILSLLLVAVVFGFTACNDDPTDNDVALASQLPGVWQLTYSYEIPGTSPDADKVENVDVKTYDFSANSNFYYSESVTSNKEPMAKQWAVRGQWSVYKGILQLNYNVDSFTSSRMSEQEIQTKKKELEDSNLLLKQLNDNGRAYGSALSFDTYDGKRVLKLEGVNGLFVKVSYASAPAVAD